MRPSAVSSMREDLRSSGLFLRRQYPAFSIRSMSLLVPPTAMARPEATSKTRHAPRRPPTPVGSNLLIGRPRSLRNLLSSASQSSVSNRVSSLKRGYRDQVSVPLFIKGLQHFVSMEHSSKETKY